MTLGKLFLSPVSAVCQMRPDFSFIDESDEKKKAASQPEKPKVESTPKQVIQRMKAPWYPNAKRQETFVQYKMRSDEEEWIESTFVPKHV